MATIRRYRTKGGDRRYEVRFRGPQGRQRSRSFSVHKDAQAFKLDVERKHQAGVLYAAPPERFGNYAKAWLERYERGAAGRVRPRPSTVVTAREVLAKLAPLNDHSLERIRRPVVEDLMATLAGETPRRAEMALTFLKRILRSAEERGQTIDPAVFHVRIAKPEEREPRFLTWEEVEEVQSWIPEYISRIVPVAVLTMLRRGEILGLREPRRRPRAGHDLGLRSGAGGKAHQDENSGGPPDGRRWARRPQAPTRAAARADAERRRPRLPHPDRHDLNFMYRVFKPAARAAAIPELTFHDLRHTGASLMIAAGCHVKVIADQMGHADGGALVLSRYGHLYKGARREAAIALESHVFGAARDSDVGCMWDGPQQSWDLR
ncbi:MAG: tyrosine-type recombinase/integrase [Gaiellaceae bacterium]